MLRTLRIMLSALEEKSAKLSNEWLKLAMRLVDGPFCSDMERD